MPKSARTEPTAISATGPRACRGIWHRPWLDYTVPGDGKRGDLTLGGGVRYIGQTYGDEANTVSVAAYTLVDAAVSYKVMPDVTFAVNATNLFDRKYVASSYFGTEYYGDRRKVVGTLKYSW